MEWALVVAGGIFGVGVLLFFLFASRRTYRRHPAIEHYVKVRDELSGLEPEKEEERSEESSGGTGGNLIGALIGLVVVAIVGINVFTMVKGSIFDVCAASNSSIDLSLCPGMMGTTLTVLPIILILGAGGMIVTVFGAFGRR